MLPYDCLSNFDLELIDRCVNRANGLIASVLRCDLELSLVKAHATKPINLEKLLDFSDANFMHDVIGIVRHVDAHTGHLVDFSPRCGYW